MSIKRNLLLASFFISTQIQAIPAIEEHVKQFAQTDNQGVTFFNGTTVTNGLSELGGKYSSLKGPLIAAFNANHLGNKIPGTDTQYSNTIEGCIAKGLHLGTTRIWNEKGEFDEARWQMLIDHINTVETKPERQNKLYKTTLKGYLAIRAESDPEEQNTGRNTNNFLSNRQAQITAADKGWDEVYELFACGWTWSDELHDYEPYLSLEVARMFFEDPHKLYEMSKNKQLPVAKPAR